MTAADVPKDLVLDRLEDQLGWYDKSSNRAQRNFKILKTLTFVLAGLVPLSAAFDMPAAIAAVLGFGVLVAEGVLQLNQFEQHWLMYRSTAEMLKHEKYLFLASAGPYADAENPRRMLAERVESLVSQEHARWVASHEESRKKVEEKT
jgi:hypothetical protein